jgi:hypothetical protein
MGFNSAFKGLNWNLDISSFLTPGGGVSVQCRLCNTAVFGLSHLELFSISDLSIAPLPPCGKIEWFQRNVLPENITIRHRNHCSPPLVRIHIQLSPVLTYTKSSFLCYSLRAKVPLVVFVPEIFSLECVRLFSPYLLTYLAHASYSKSARFIQIMKRLGFV